MENLYLNKGPIIISIVSTIDNQFYTLTKYAFLRFQK
ncbi:hypothetical protein CACET_c08520 [Clostridium aceticum]|uniref:Uncharacterized protein n=1 Tax=Clostridium aceticum TaxID=84022 RepID=A0A0G3W6M4_9CLOT|nr:hypothetical protein CACET_c08520 [Clostridium aceticum]